MILRSLPRWPGETRRGGFGGVAGLTAFLQRRAIDLVIDATHPFAATISANAVAACRRVGVPRLVLCRPPWPAQPYDRWIRVADAAAAATVLPELGRRIFLTTGQRDIAAFSALETLWFLVRLIDPPQRPLPLANHMLILGRGPFSAFDEAVLFAEHGIDVLVAKNSGGLATYGKIEAARKCGLPVVMIERPPAPEGDIVATVDAALAWINTYRPPGPTPAPTSPPR